jgi:hypothetical protein
MFIGTCRLIVIYDWSSFRMTPYQKGWVAMNETNISAVNLKRGGIENRR